MDKFGYIDRLNGMDQFPYWNRAPCSNIAGSEGSFFPPREYTKENAVYLYDKDLCRVIPLEYQHPVVKDGKYCIIKYIHQSILMFCKCRYKRRFIHFTGNGIWKFSK